MEDIEEFEDIEELVLLVANTLGARFIVAASKKNPALSKDNGKSRIFFFYFLCI